MAVVVDRNSSYDALENYANLAYVVDASDTDNLCYYSVENVVLDRTTAYRMDFDVVALRHGMPYQRYRVGKMADYRTNMTIVTMAAIAGRVDVVMIYCCRCVEGNFRHHLIHLNFELKWKIVRWEI